ncbi:hypothetical protein Pcinc_019162 [Petrolisthes cinctipes]|uniref:Uncharacterized protein n=1 Tax=Petrolisthes cinctipes TaxID=88211 RepID=A0AAE1KLK6_PETCI|nr:hypothetical protein Pcinc_019162 [Petrolisthes cinctipes]
MGTKEKVGEGKIKVTGDRSCGEGKEEMHDKEETEERSKNGIDAPLDVDLMEVIRIPEVSNKRSIAEVLSQVVKLERSSSSSASEVNPTPEAPDIVASTTRDKGHHQGGKSSARNETRRADVATLVLLCQHYAHLVQALKEENYLLSCTQSPLMPATPKSGIRNSRGRTSGKNIFTWDSEAVQNIEQIRTLGLCDDRDVSRVSLDPQRASSDNGVPHSPGTVKLHRSSSSSRDYYSRSPRQSPARIQDDCAALNLKEKRHWNLRPLRNASSKHKRDSKPHRKSSFSFFRETKETGDLEEEENTNDSPTLQSFQNPTVGVLSTKISEMETKIDELLKLEPVSDILRDSSVERSPVSTGDNLRRNSSKRGNFYRHSVREPLRDKRHQDVRDIEDTGDDVYKKGSGGGTCLGNGGCQYQTLAQAAHVEVDKLRQLVNLLNTRLTEMSGRMLAAETKLREEQHKAAMLERCLERQNLDTNNDGTSCRSGCRAPRSSSEGGIGRRHRPSVLAWGDVASETLLRNKVEMAREEIELLRQHIDLLLRMRQEDLKVYESTVDKFRHTLASGSRW